MIIEPTLSDRQHLSRSLVAAGKLDNKIAEVVALYGDPEPRFRAPGFTTLMRIIVSQLLSTKAAASIWGKVDTAFGSSVSSAAVLNADGQTLRDCGLSWRKVEYSQILASRFETGELEAASLTKMDTAEVIKTLTTIKGIGVWSAEIYAMFALRHGDVFPAGDLALQVGIQRLLGLDERPSEKASREIAERWSPYRSSVSLMLWKYYGATTME